MSVRQIWDNHDPDVPLLRHLCLVLGVPYVSGPAFSSPAFSSSAFSASPCYYTKCVLQNNEKQSINPFARNAWSGYAIFRSAWVSFRPPSLHVKSCSDLVSMQTHERYIRYMPTEYGCEQDKLAGSHIMMLALQLLMLTRLVVERAGSVHCYLTEPACHAALVADSIKTASSARYDSSGVSIQRNARKKVRNERNERKESTQQTQLTQLTERLL